MNDSTNTDRGDVHDEVRGYFTLVEINSPMTLVARMLPIATPVAGTLNAAPGADSSIIAILRHPDEPSQVQGYAIKLADFEPNTPVVSTFAWGMGTVAPGQGTSMIGVLTCRKAGKDQQE